MGILKSLFEKKSDKPNVKVSLEMKKEGSSIVNNENKVSKKIQDLILIYFSEKYKVQEKNFPDSFRSDYGIGFPAEKYKELEKKGFIRPSSASETLPFLKVAELKNIASQFGLKQTGKKDELCKRIAESVTEEELDKLIEEKYWRITEKGNAFLSENPYISFYFAPHEYHLRYIGLDINSFSKLFQQQNSGRVRDVLWGEFNRRSIEYFQKALKNGDFYDYCELLHTMALFLKEEKRYEEAFKKYMSFLHYRANFKAGMNVLQYYYVWSEFDILSVRLYGEVEMDSFIAREIMSISEGCGYDSELLKRYMLEAFSEEQDIGLFSPKELTELTMYGLNGDKENEKKLCDSALKVALKKLPKRKRKR